MRYIILTVLLFLNTTLSTSNIPPEDNQRSHSKLSYLESAHFPEELKFRILEDFSLEHLLSFEITSKENHRLVQKYYQRTLDKLRHQIETIFSNSGYFNDGEEAIAAANLFLEAYFPNVDAIKSFMRSTINEPGTPSKAFLEYISNAFSKNEEGKIGYFELRNLILQNMEHMERTYMLSFQNHDVFFLPPEIGYLTNLRDLDLRNNQLRALPPELWNLTNLQGINLRNNRLTEIPRQIVNLINLESIDLANNLLTEIPAEMIGPLSHLELYLSGNPAEIPPELMGLESDSDDVYFDSEDSEE